VAETTNAMRVPAIIAMVFAATILSSSGVIVRHIEHAVAWQIVFFRAVSLIPAISLLYVFRHRGRVIHEPSRAGWVVVYAGAIQGFSSVCFVQAMTHTSVANAMFVLSALPFFAAALGWLFLRERVERRTLIAIAASCGGIGLVMVDGVASGTMVGNAFALANSVLAACFVIVLRQNRGVDMLPAIVVGAMVAASVAAIAVPDFNVSLHDIMLCVLWGAVVQCSAQVITIFAARYLRAAELCLLSLIESVLAPLWVWLTVSEVPSHYSMIGGAIVMLSVALWTVRRRDPPGHGARWS
jgi:drug/metabolite transporter, DME family